MLNNTYVLIKEIGRHSVVGEVFIDNESDGELEVIIDYMTTDELSLNDMRELVASKWIALEDEFQKLHA